MTKKELAAFKEKVALAEKKAAAEWACMSKAEKKKLRDIADRFEKKVRSSIE